MFDSTSLLGFALLAFGMAITPGPNMIYLISRSVCQGKAAGMTSLMGVALAFLVYMLAAAFGITALLFAVPFAYDTLRFAGAAYLLYLAWQTLRPGARSAFQVRNVAPASARRLFAMGFVTSFLNPKIAVFYLSLLPQFIAIERGHVLGQSLVLGSIQIVISVGVNAAVVIAGGAITAFLGNRPAWLAAQRLLMGTVLAGLGIRMAFASNK